MSQERIEEFEKEEKKLIAAYERGDYVPDASSADALKDVLHSAAQQHLRKDARINIRLSSADLTMLKRRAAEEGLPYQTLVASVLHKYVNGRLTSDHSS